MIQIRIKEDGNLVAVEGNVASNTLVVVSEDKPQKQPLPNGIRPLRLERYMSKWRKYFALTSKITHHELVHLTNFVNSLNAELVGGELITPATRLYHG